MYSKLILILSPRLMVLMYMYHSLPPSQINIPVTLNWTLDEALRRWNISISVFAHIFLAEGPGGERNNFLNNRAGFASRMARFRHQVRHQIAIVYIGYTLY